MRRYLLWLVSWLVVVAIEPGSMRADELQRVTYHRPPPTVDLGVGLWAWPLPMDVDGDRDMDLVVVCPDKPYNGTYFFENPGSDADDSFPVFKPAVRWGPAQRNPQLSYVNGQPIVMTPGKQWPEFAKSGFRSGRTIHPKSNVHPAKVRANQWKQVDYDGDGQLDLIVGVGDWAAYGWDNAFNAEGQWQRGPLHGWVYLLKNRGTNATPDYEQPRKLEAAGRPVDVFGMPSPNVMDFDGDGDLDLLCGEFLDGFTYFENRGTRQQPSLAAGRRLVGSNGRPLTMDLQMIVPAAVDWDADGDVDLIVGDEDGRVAWVEHTGQVADGLPVFQQPRYFQQQGDDLKWGALVTPVGFDWDSDGDQDIVAGNTAGYIGWFENLDGAAQPKWAPPRYLKVGEQPIRIQAGQNGSIQGPAEAKWGYTTLTVGDWDGDGKHDLVVNSIWGRVDWYRNVGAPGEPRFSTGRPVRIDWEGTPRKPAWNWWDPAETELATQWRTTPCMYDWDHDGLMDLIMLDHEGYLAWFQRERRNDRLWLRAGTRLFVDEKGQPLQLNAGEAGRSGRRKLCLADWDGDGRVDLLVNSKNADWYRNLGERQGRVVLRSAGPLDDRVLAGHTTSPTVVDWNRDGIPDLLVGAEDGRLYFKRNPREK